MPEIVQNIGFSLIFMILDDSGFKFRPRNSKNHRFLELRSRVRILSSKRGTRMIFDSTKHISSKYDGKMLQMKGGW